MTLSGQQYQQLTYALLNAFPSLVRLDEMIRFRLDKNIHAIALGDDLKEIIFKLVRAAEAEGWIIQLIVAARESNPGNAMLLAFAQQFNLAPATPSHRALERIIKSKNRFLDINMWRERLGKIETQVCRVEIESNLGTVYGTGFLLGPDIVMTNYHVVEAVIKGERGQTTSQGLWAMPSNAILRFDYKQLADGTTLNPGTICRLASHKWLIDSSPYASDTRLARSDQLDYALLRVDHTIGYEPVGKNPEPEAPLRRWIKVPKHAYDFQPGTSLIIVQHPDAQPLKLAIDTDTIIGLNGNGTTVTYKTNTLPGSSGSPCFNIDLELIALHHSGDPNFNPTYNAGTPFTAILDLLDKRGLRGELDEQQS